MPALLASSSTLEGIEKLVNQYYFSTTYRVTPELEIVRMDGYKPEGVRIVHKRNRYRFESF